MNAGLKPVFFVGIELGRTLGLRDPLIAPRRALPSKRDTVLRSIPSFRAMADFERPLANNSRTCNTSSPLYIPSPPLGRVWRRRSSEVGIFHSGDFAEYVSGGFVHFSSGDDTGTSGGAAGRPAQPILEELGQV